MLRRELTDAQWERLFKALVDDPDFEYLIVDSTVVRANQHAARAFDLPEDSGCSVAGSSSEPEGPVSIVCLQSAPLGHPIQEIASPFE